jgi:Saxitoxin biosynthesis operon protein SxtJ
MQWSDVIKPPPARVLRQFAGLWIAFFLGLAAWRWFHGHADARAVVMAVAALVVGVPGVFVPAFIRPIYTGWMIAAFPIGWTVSRIVLGLVFFLVVAPLAAVFRMSGRDVLGRRRTSVQSYWKPRAQQGDMREYMRQS